MSRPALGGVVAASITPVTPDGQIDAGRLARHVARLLEDGCDFVSTFGTTGEGVSLGTTQKAEALRAMVRLGVDMGRQLPSVMTSTVADAAQSLRTAGQLGCRAALVLPPFYYPSWSDAGIVDFFVAATGRAERDAPPVDLILYNIPQFSGVPFSPDLVRMMIDRFGERIVGMKDSTGDREQAVMLATTFPDLSIFTGDDRVLPHLMRAGGAGIIGGMPNLFSRDLAEVVRDPDSAAAQAIGIKSARRIEVLDGNGGLAAIKAMLAFHEEDPALALVMPPLRPLDAATTGKVVELVAGTGFTPVRPTS